MEAPAPNHPGDNIKPQTTEQSSEEKPPHSECEEETTIPQCQEEGEQRSASAALGANEDDKVPVSDPSASVYGVFLEEEEPRSASLGLGPGEMDSPQLVGSPPAFPSAEEPQETQEANKVFALVAATTVATSAVAEMAVDTEKSPPSESEESGIPQCEEDGEQQLAEEDEKAPTFEPLDTIAAGNEAMQEEAEEMAVDAVEPSKVASRRGGRRRKRGRLSTAQGVRARAPAKPKEDEDLCFICFDGGDLVVCDHRGCPKVYHPSCVNRDEAYFRAKGRWNCGWHICSNCQKSARYMCYTCTYSLCKGCIKEAEFACIRGNKGFCETCMKTVMLIETNEHADEKMVGVDFDDKSSWLYLFKDYWLDLKAKLSLTVEELMRARTPSKGSNVVSHNEESLDILDDASDDQGASSSSSSGCCKESISSRKKVKKRPRSTANKESSVKEAEVEGTSIPEYIEWASRDLLEFVAHMKNGDRPVLSQFDVQALLLEYIKRNNLRDPRKKSQIVCDSRLRTLFGKSRVGHLEMLKLLESHFLIKEASPLATDDNQGGVVDPDPSQMDAEGNSDASTKMTSDRRWKACRRIEKKEMANLDDYAAIDVHNINLMYLRRNLMEELLDDIDMFNENVVGSFVRIRISGSGQKQDMYRLVQVVGTGKTTEKYKTGKRATDVTLEILNLNKREIITIDIISNQEFTEEECKRLRQSVKCGFIGRLTVGEVQEKARALQVVRVTDWLESEKLRLGHLRDRASEKGRRKELRECVEKLQLLSTPEERMRRLNEVPEIHSDPNMDPDYESAEDEEDLDAKKQDNGNQPWESSFKGRDVHSLGKGGPAAWKNSDITWQSNRSTSKGVQDVELSTAVAERTNELFGDQGKVVRQISSPETPKTEANTTGMDAGDRNNNQPMTKPGLSSGVPSETTPGSMSTNFVAPSNTSETEKMWHYQDPSGKIQGPFSMAQLRKWNTTGYFPANLRIWRISEKQEDSILLTDALIGKFHKDLPRQEPQQNSTTQLTKLAAKMGTRGNNLDGGWRENNNCQIEASFPNTGSNNLTKADRWTTPSSLSATNTGVVNPVDGRPVTSLRGWEASKDTNARSGQPQVHNSPRPITPFSRYSSQPPSFQGRDGRGNTGRWNGDRGRQNNWNSNKPRRFQPTGRGYERQHPYQSSSSQQFPGEQWKVQPANDSSNQLGNNSSFNLPAHTPQPSSIDWTSLQGALNKILPPASSVQPLTSGLSTTPRGNEAQQSLSTTKDSNKTSTMNSVGGWASSSVPNVTSVQIQEKVDVLTNFQTSNQQNKPSETAASIILENQPVFSGSNSTEFMGGLDRKQWLESHHPNPTKCEQAAAAVLNSECSQPAQSQLSETGDHTVALCHELDTDKNCPEAHDRSSSESKKICVDGKGLGPASVAPALGSSNLPDALESVSAQRSEASSSPKPQSASQCWAPVSAQQQGPDGSNVNPAQPLNMGWGMVLQNPNPGTGTAQEIGNMVYRTAIQGNANMGWGMVAQGVMDVAWGTPANLNMGWGQPAQATANASLGLAIPAQENANMNLAWGAPAQGNTNPNAGWGATMQVTSALNPGWLVPALGNTNPNPGWVAPTEGNTIQNASCGTPMQGTGQGIMNSMSMAWNPSGGNPSSWNAQQEQAGDGHSGQGDGVFHSSGSGRAKSGAGGGLSRPTPPPGGQRGVCKFHENGHCKKGASCNYIHS